MPHSHHRALHRWWLFGVLLSIGLGLGTIPETSRNVQADELNGLTVAAALEDAFVKAIESAEKSVVAIGRDRRDLRQADRRNDFFGQERTNDPADPNWIPSEFGAGLVIDKAGLILTNYHLVRGGPVEGRPEQKSEQLLYVRLPDRRGFEATIFAADPRSDLAVLKIAANDLIPLKIETAPAVRKGQIVLAIGNPYAIARNGSASATWGIVGNIGRQASLEGEVNDPERLKAETIHHLGTLLQVDTRLELGTSGGALLNLKGECIGMTTSLAALVGYEKSSGFAIPFDESMKRIIELLRQGKEVEYGFLGVQPVDIHPAEVIGPEFALIRERLRKGAVRILETAPNLPAGRAGLNNGDIILKVGRHDVYGKNDLMREIGLTGPGEIIRLSIFRQRGPGGAGQELEIPVEVGKWPAVDEEGIIAPVPNRPAWRGLIYDFSTSRRRFLAFPMMHEPFEGVRVVKVTPGSPAADSDLQFGDLITHVKGQAVRSPREFADAVQKASGTVALQVWSPGNRTNLSRTIEIRR
ncbi:MAG: trypsin-like peptidase domain-containing protein [Planctomycetes bacterium]|nr:trypsin-like peptidase domain-containing protein [Planctomycetota bacterium]